MIPIILRVTKVGLAFLLALFASSCRFEIDLPKPISGSGNVIAEKREVSGTFDKIQVSSVFDVEIEQAPTHEITIKADDNLIPHIITEIEGSTLNIRFKNNISIRNTKDLKVYVKLPNITELRASASSSIEAKKEINSDNLILKTSSTGEIKLHEINAKSIIAEASSSSEIKIEKLYTTDFRAQTSSTGEINVEYAEIDSIDLTASSSSDIEIKGKALDLTVNTSSTASVDAKELWVNNAVISSSSSSTVKVYPIVSLKAKASSTADIYYYNDPKTIEKDTSSSGSIKKKNR